MTAFVGAIDAVKGAPPDFLEVGARCRSDRVFGRGLLGVVSQHGLVEQLADELGLL